MFTKETLLLIVITESSFYVIVALITLFPQVFWENYFIDFYFKLINKNIFMFYENKMVNIWLAYGNTDERLCIPIGLYNNHSFFCWLCSLFGTSRNPRIF